MKDWRWIIRDIKEQVYRLKLSNTQAITVDELERYLNSLEVDYQVLDKQDILTEINNRNKPVLNDYSELIDKHIELVATSYEKGSTYTIAVVGGGYATFFALWSLTKQYLPESSALWAAIMLSISACSFIFLRFTRLCSLSL